MLAAIAASRVGVAIPYVAGPGLALQAGGAAANAGQPTSNCLSGRVTAKAVTDAGKTLDFTCLDGDGGVQMAVAITDDTSFVGGITFDDLAEADDVAVSLEDASVAPSDAFTALPAAASVESKQATARKRPPAAPVQQAPQSQVPQPLLPQPAPAVPTLQPQTQAPPSMLTVPVFQPRPVGTLVPR